MPAMHAAVTHGGHGHVAGQVGGLKDDIFGPVPGHPLHPLPLGPVLDGLAVQLP